MDEKRDIREKFYKQMEPAYKKARKGSWIDLIKPVALFSALGLLLYANHCDDESPDCNTTAARYDQDASCFSDEFGYPDEE